MVATRKDRGNSWASRAPLNDDRAPLVAKLVEATFSSWACSWGPGGCFVVSWLVDSLYPPPNCELERTSRFRRWHRPSRSFSWSGKRRLAFFFSVKATLVTSRMSRWTAGCAVLKSAPSGSQRGAEPTTCKGPERLLRTSAVSDLDVPTTYHKCVSRVFKSLSLRTVRMPQQRPVSARTSTSVTRTRSSFSAFALTETHIVKVTGKGATTTLPIPSPSHPCSRRRDRRSKLRKARRTKHEDKVSISI